MESTLPLAVWAYLMSPCYDNFGAFPQMALGSNIHKIK